MLWTASARMNEQFRAQELSGDPEAFTVYCIAVLKENFRYLGDNTSYFGN